MSFKRGIRFKFAVFIGAFIVALMAVDALWNVQLQQQQAENEAREKAEVLADEMHAMWDFIDINQNTINRTEDGAFRTKALVCVVTAKSVSTLFTMNTDYKISTRAPPRARRRTRPTSSSSGRSRPSAPMRPSRRTTTWATTPRGGACSATPSRCT